MIIFVIEKILAKLNGALTVTGNIPLHFVSDFIVSDENIEDARKRISSYSKWVRVNRCCLWKNLYFKRRNFFNEYVNTYLFELSMYRRNSHI